jgi:cell pole-organizing protein PopZ
MSQPAKAPEPTIDEILASIRRSIVPEDDADKPARKSASRKPPGPTVISSGPSGAKGRRADGDSVRSGADAAGDHGPDRRPFDNSPPLKREARLPEGDSEGEADNDSGGPEEEAASAIPLTEAPEAAEPDTRHDAAPEAPLLSSRTSAVVDTAFNSLTHTVLSQNPRTLEDLVREMLKPMLKAWLDANLPDMVERMVRAEIERVSRRG